MVLGVCNIWYLSKSKMMLHQFKCQYTVYHWAKEKRRKLPMSATLKKGFWKKWTNQHPGANILCSETQNKFRVCVDPSQTINKTIESPIYQMPTLKFFKVLKLENAKCFTVIDVKDGFLHIPLMKIPLKWPLCTQLMDVTTRADYHLVSIVHLKNFKCDSWTH